MNTGVKTGTLAAKEESTERKDIAFKEQFKLYAPKIYHFGMSYLKSVHDSEELVQDVFMKVWNQYESLDESRNIKAYIFKIAVNLIYDQLRKRKLDKLAAELTALNAVELEDTTWNTLSFNELQSQIDMLISQMPDQRRLVFTLSRVEGLSYEEIAKKLNISIRTVENQVYRALAFLKLHIHTKYLLYFIFYYLY